MKVREEINYAEQVKFKRIDEISQQALVICKKHDYGQVEKETNLN